MTAEPQASIDAAAPPIEQDVPDRSRGYMRTTLKHGGVYTIGMVLSRMIGFIMIPVYTRVLTPADYGVLEVLSLATDVLGMLAGMGIGIAVMRGYDAAEGTDERHAVASSAATLLIGVFSLVALAGIWLSGILAPVLIGQGGSPTLVRLAVIVLALGSIIEVPMAVLRARQNSTSVVAVGLARLVLSLALNIVFVVILRLGVQGVLYSSLLTSLIIGGVLTVRLYRESGIHFDLPILRRLIAFGAPLIVWNIASFVLHYSDRFFLRAYDSLAAVGLYSLSYKFAMLVSIIVVGPFSEIWIPKALEIQRREGDGSVPILASILRVYNLVLVSVAFFVSLFAGDVIRLVTGQGFHAAAGTVPLLSLAMVVFGYRNVAQIGALIRGRSDLVAISAAVAAVAVLVLNLLLIPRWGVTGAAYATFGAFLLEFLLMRRLSHRVHPLEVGLLTLGAPMAIGATVLGAVQLVASPELGTVPGLALHVLAAGAYVAALLATGAIPPSLRAALSLAVRRPSEAIQLLRGS